MNMTVPKVRITVILATMENSSMTRDPSQFAVRCVLVGTAIEKTFIWVLALPVASGSSQIAMIVVR